MRKNFGSKPWCYLQTVFIVGTYDENGTPDSCHLVGRIVNVSADESILDANGRIDSAKLRPVTFDPIHNDYLEIGAKVGDAYHEGLALKK